MLLTYYFCVCIFAASFVLRILREVCAMTAIEEAREKFNISTEERKIGLTNIFGKASTALGIASGGYVGFELGRVIVFATNTATQNVFNPADHVLPGLIAFGLSMSLGLTGMYLGRQKHKLVDEFNYQVRKEFANMGFELIDDEAAPESKPQKKWVRHNSAGSYGPVVHHRTPDRFWEGFWLSSLANSGSRSSRSSSYSSSPSRSSSSGNSGQGAAIALAAIVLAAAAAACVFVSYKSFQLNFLKKAPDLLTGPDPDIFGLEVTSGPQEQAAVTAQKATP